MLVILRLPNLGWAKLGEVGLAFGTCFINEVKRQICSFVPSNLRQAGRHRLRNLASGCRYRLSETGKSDRRLHALEHVQQAAKAGIKRYRNCDSAHHAT
jgi:hypothetical protein